MNNAKRNIILVAVGLFFLVGGFVLLNCMGINNVEEYRVVQYPNGTIRLVDEPGVYGEWFGKVTVYPRARQVYYSESTKEGGEDDDSIFAIFNDGGRAKISAMVQYGFPQTPEERLELHRNFGGSIEAIDGMIRAHLISSTKTTAPLMSASEHQSARKAEFENLIDRQMSEGTYKMRKVERELKDRTDENGDPITVFATEIVYEKDADGNALSTPIIEQASPLSQYGISILQFSVTNTRYDARTEAQFDAKKEAYLHAENSKAEREQEVQQRLMVEERGKREKAEVEAVALKEKAEAVIKAEKEKQVAETEAAKKVAVAELEKAEAEQRKLKAMIEADQRLEVARLERQAAEEQAEAIKVLALAEEERIQRAGAITEEKKVLAEIERDRAIGVAASLSKVNVPSIVLNGGSANGEGNDMQDTLMNLYLMRQTGVLREDADGSAPIAPPVLKEAGN